MAGRSQAGPPGLAGGQLLEHRLRDKLAAQIGGITEASLKYGRPDVLTSRAVFEVEPAPAWRHGVRQVLAYAAETRLPPAIALFGAIHRDDLTKLYMRLRGDLHHGEAGKVALWWWDGLGWVHIRNRGACRNMPSPRAG